MSDIPTMDALHVLDIKTVCFPLGLAREPIKPVEALSEHQCRAVEWRATRNLRVRCRR